MKSILRSIVFIIVTIITTIMLIVVFYSSGSSEDSDKTETTLREVRTSASWKPSDLIEKHPYVIVMVGDLNCSSCRTLYGDIESDSTLSIGSKTWILVLPPGQVPDSSSRVFDVYQLDHSSSSYPQDLVATPTIMAFRYGQQIFRHDGYISKDKLVKKLSTLYE